MRNPIQNAIELVRESKLTACKRCGAKDLAWIQLKTTSKWCLVNTSKRRPFYRGDNQPPTAPDGYTYAIKMSYHSCDQHKRKLADDAAYIANLRAQQAIWRNENQHTAVEMLNSALVRLWLDCEDKQNPPAYLTQAMQTLALLSGELKSVLG